jgi:hypothetical protein
MAYEAVIHAGRLTSLELKPVSEVQIHSSELRVTADSCALPGLEGVQVSSPSAARLAQIVSNAPAGEIEALTLALLEPHYVQEAFITKPKAKQ